ncbi:MAG: transcription elongation factor GreA [Leptospiraceae bacterium]|nr:MAG: transcription elongation factor GreA [Leptospiraceae bacterium]
MNPSTETQNKNLLNKLYTYINEEKLTKDFSSYQLNKIENYVNLAQEIANSSEDEQKEILQTLAEYKNTENDKTILGRLIPPIIAFKKTLDRDPSEEDKLFDLILSLLHDFQLATRWSIIVYICDVILSFFPEEIEKLKNHPGIVDILKYKQDAIEKLKGKKETKSILKTIIEIDKKDADSCVKYAKLIHTEDPEEAGIYFKRAAEIYVKENKTDKLEEIWKILVEDYFEDLKFFERLERILNSNKNYNFIVAFFPQLVEKYKEIEDWDTVINLLKKIIANAIEQDKREENEKRLKGLDTKYRKKESKALTRLREELIKAYRQKYKNHSLLDIFLRLSELTNPKKPINIGISNFEKYIVFDTNNYVYHRKRGVGKIKEINEKYVIIDFDKNPNQKMTLDMAISSLQALQPDHIWVRYYENPEELKRLCKEDKLEFFRILLESYNKKITLAQIKAEVVDKLIPKSEWNKWWQDARKLLKESKFFGFSPKKRDEILMWERELTYAEELENKFNNIKEWDKKLEIALESLTVSPEITEKASESFAEFYLTQEESKDPYKRIMVYLFFDLFEKTYPSNPIVKSRRTQKEDILELIENLDKKQISQIFHDIKNTDFKKQFIDLIIEAREDYENILEEILLQTPIKVHKYIIEKLNNLGRKEILKDYIETIFRKYREYPEIFLWISKNILENDWEQEYDWIDTNKFDVLLQIFRLLKPLERIETRGNRLKNLAIETIFGTQNITVETLEKSKIKEYIEKADENFIKRIFILFKNVPYIPDAHKDNFKIFINKLRPDITNLEISIDTELEELEEEISKQEEKIEIFIPSDDIIYTTQESIEAKRKHLDHILYVEMPENSREIGEAQEKGDLRENAEYKAALERQDKLRAEATKLEEDLKKAVPIDPSKVRTDVVTIGTKVTLKDQTTGDIISYTILGLWDVNPDNNIISYASPLGKILLGKKPGEIASLSKEKSFIIEKIEKAI